MDVLTATQMCEKLQVSRETFRKTWKRFPHIFAGEGEDLRSARFLWDDESLAEAVHGGTPGLCWQARKLRDEQKRVEFCKACWVNVAACQASDSAKSEREGESK